MAIRQACLYAIPCAHRALPHYQLATGYSRRCIIACHNGPEQLYHMLQWKQIARDR